MATPTEQLQQQLEAQASQLYQEVQQRKLLSQKLAESEARCRHLEGSERDRLQAENALHHYQSRFRQIVATAPGMIYESVLHPDGSASFLYASPKCVDLFEIEPAALVQDNRCLWSLVHSEDWGKVQTAVMSAIAHRTLIDVEFRIITPSGIPKWIQAISYPGDLDSRDLNSGDLDSGDLDSEDLRSKNASIWSGFMLDISRCKQIELELQQAKEMALQEAARSAEAYQSRNGLLKTLTHDLRTPLNAILGFSQILRRDLTLTAKQQEHLHIIHRSAEDLLTSINHLLEISKPNADGSSSSLQAILAPQMPPSLENSSILEPSLLSFMSDEWMQQLHQAVIRASNRRLLELVQQIPEDHEAIATTLTQKINDFDFEQIIDLAQQAMKQRGLLYEGRQSGSNEK